MSQFALHQSLKMKLTLLGTTKGHQTENDSGKQPTKLLTKEIVKSGAVSAKTYSAYIKAAGG